MGWVLTTLLCVFVLSVLADGADAEIDWKSIAQDALKEALKQEPKWGVAKNVIILIGDGMGVSTVTASRIHEGQTEGKLGEEHDLTSDKFPYVALSKTYDASHQVPDSSSTATAIMCGEKVRTGTIGMSQDAERGKCETEDNASKPRQLTSILDWSLDAGKSVGLVSTARITHATPAATYAHSVDRGWESDSDIPEEAREKCGDLEDVALQLVRNNPRIRVLLGGGRRNFFNNTLADLEYGDEVYGKREDGRNLVEEWIAEKEEQGASYAYVWNDTDFRNIDAADTDYLLGLFEPTHMQFEKDRPTDSAGEPSLTEMTEKAIQMLSHSNNDKGFFLLVEGGRIDHAHHHCTARIALEETMQFMSAVQKAVDMTDESDTLIIVTADHSHVLTIGGLSLRGNPILSTVDDAAIAKEPATDNPNATYLTLMYANGPGPTRQLDLAETDTETYEFLQTVAVPVGSETHGGEDVAIYARGPMAHLFQGTQEQHYIAHVMAYASCVGANKEHCDEDAKRELCPDNSAINVHVGADIVSVALLHAVICVYVTVGASLM